MRHPATLIPPFANLQSSHPDLTSQLPPQGIDIHTFPFSVGRARDALEDNPGELVDLPLTDQRPFWIARVQFTLLRDHDGIRLIDASSIYGNLVNGIAIGPGTDLDSVLLENGSNTIQMGDHTSPYVLTMTIEGSRPSKLAA